MEIKLKRLLIETDEFDDRELEDLEGVDAIVQYLQAHGKEPQVVDLAGSKYVLYDDMIVEPDWPWPKKKEQWLYDNSARQLRDQLMDEIERRFNDRFWKHPEPLYHGTPKENVESIQREGLKMKHISRGFSNRHIHAAVFTEMNPEYCQYHYGPEVFMIDTPQMKADGFMPRVEKEPNHLESEVLNAMAHKIGAWEDDKDLANPMSEGTSEDTVIIFSNIPPKYLKLL
jgi:hypothetical protein